MQIIIDEISKRLPLGEDSRRLFHGRGQCFSGYDDVVIDWFQPVVLVMLYRPREADWLKQLCGLLCDLLPAVTAIVLQERFLPNAPSRLLCGQLPEQVDAVEAGLRYRLRLTDAQNVGFFPDVATGRQLIRRIAKGKKILNLFAYSCSFSVAALAGGAEQVVNLDMNRGALELGRLNHQLNQLDLRSASFLPVELFRSFGKLKKLSRFDLVICDPPAYQGKSFKAERDWPKLLSKLPQILAPRAEILACLNAPHLPPEFLRQLFAELLPQAQLLETLQPGEDFPEATAACGVWMLHYRMP
ncbi:MAG TPA: class I SAM-dependent methyltransferase [Malonomonas sp.]